MNRRIEYTEAMTKLKLDDKESYDAIVRHIHVLEKEQVDHIAILRDKRNEMINQKDQQIKVLREAIDFARDRFHLPQDVYDRFSEVYPRKELENDK